MPMSIGFFFNTMYNVVDSFYAGRISTEALAAMALSFPVFFIIIAVSEGIARGASALIANAIGEQDRDKERSYSGQVFSLGLICALVLTLVGLNVAEPLFRLMGASGDYLKLATDYMHPLFWASVFFILSSMSYSILLAHGDSKTFGKVLVIGFFFNLLLDPWFMYGGFGLPAMGIKGIAYATVLIQVVGSIYLLSVVIRRGYVTSRCLEWFAPKLKIYWEILRQGIPTSFNMMSIALGFFVITFYLQSYGEVAVAAFGVGTRIEQIFLLPTIGLGSAIVSIVGQNNGAGKLDRVRDCVSLCAKYGMWMILTGSVIMYFLAPVLMNIFTDDLEVVQVGTSFVRIMICTQWAYVMGFVYIGFLQAVKRPMYGFIESVIRKIVLPLCVFYILVELWKVELLSFWWSIVMINVGMALVTITYARFVMRKITGDSA